MREILFRGKRLNSGKWIFGDLQNGDQPIINSPNGFWEYVDPDTVSEFTGKRDEIGDRIYEGDVVKVRVGFDEYTGIVKYDEDSATFVVVAFERDDKVHTDKLYVGCEFITEVIGNKWNNPELLERNNG